MNNKLKEAIMIKAKEENNVSLLNWNDKCFEEIEILLQDYYGLGSNFNKCNEESIKDITANLAFNSNKSNFLKSIFSSSTETKEILLETFEYCETVNAFINMTIESNGCVLNNEIIIYFKNIIRGHSDETNFY